MINKKKFLCFMFKTGEYLRPDNNHPPGIPPHTDYRDPSGALWRIFPDGSKQLKTTPPAVLPPTKDRGLLIT